MYQKINMCAMKARDYFDEAAQAGYEGNDQMQVMLEEKALQELYSCMEKPWKDVDSKTTIFFFEPYFELYYISKDIEKGKTQEAWDALVQMTETYNPYDDSESFFVEMIGRPELQNIYVMIMKVCSALQPGSNKDVLNEANMAINETYMIGVNGAVRDWY